MSKLIYKSIEDVIEKYIDLISNQYQLNKKDLLEKWNNLNDGKINVKENNDNQPNKKTGYQIFFSLKRNELKNNNPQMTYNEITKEISNLWNKLSAQEKNQYSSEMLPTVKKFTFEELNQKKMNELKEICEKYGIKKGGNKTELIKNLLGQNNKSESKPEIKEKIVNKMTTPIQDLTVELEINQDEKRIDFQTDEIEEEYESENESDLESEKSDISESSMSLNEEDYE